MTNHLRTRSIISVIKSADACIPPRIGDSGAPPMVALSGRTRAHSCVWSRGASSPRCASCRGVRRVGRRQRGRFNRRPTGVRLHRNASGLSSRTALSWVPREEPPGVRSACYCRHLSRLIRRPESSCASGPTVLSNNRALETALNCCANHSDAATRPNTPFRLRPQALGAACKPPAGSLVPTGRWRQR